MWQHRQSQLQQTSRIDGVVFAVSRSAINRFAETKQVSRLANATG